MKSIKKHLIVINTYNRIDELNKTIRSIIKSKIKGDICIISKGNETTKEIKHPIKYFHKVINIGREAHGYIWAFLKYPHYQIYTFMQDKPYESEKGFYGKQINRCFSAILQKKCDFCTSMPLAISLSKSYLPRKVGSEININYLASKFQIPSKNYFKFSIGACFSIDGARLRERISTLKKLDLLCKRKTFAWEMEIFWMSLSNKPAKLEGKNLVYISQENLSFKERMKLAYLKAIYLFKKSRILRA